MPKLNKRTVEAIPLPAKGQTFTWDTDLKGFGVRATPGGRSYIAQARVSGKTRRTTIGAHGKFTAEEARKKARDALKKMADDIDPVAERKRKRALSMTLRELAEAYIADRRDLKPSSVADINKHLKGGFSDWADLPASSITRDKVVTRFRKMTDASPAQANQAFRILRALMNYAAATSRTENAAPFPENPVKVLSDAKLWNRVAARSRRIPPEQIGAAWTFLDQLRHDDSLTTSGRTGADLVAFLLLTGARIGEAAGLTWDRVDLDGASWHLPDPKNRQPVTFPLSPAAVSILRGRPEEGPWVFPHRSKPTHVRDARGTLAKLGEAIETEVSAHDLRRSFRAVAGACGIELWKAKLLMNHRLSGDVTISHYTETSDLRYLLPEATAISEWIEEQARIHRAGNVVSMEARA